MPKGIGNKRRYGSRSTQRLRILVTGQAQYLLAILLLLVGCLAGIVLYHIDEHTFLYFGDAASHMVRARQLFDSQRPGFQNIGTVWLPLPHLILLPLVAFDAFFYSGIAGPIIGIPCLAGTAVLLFLMVRRITESSSIALLSGFLFGLNPNLVYMALTPMNELLFIVLVALGGYALLRWLLNEADYWLGVCASAVVLASLCRYEGWFLVAFVSLLSGSKGMTLWRGGRRGAALRFLAISAACWAGIVFWLVWNYSAYDDPLKFARWTYSVAPGTARGNVRQSPLDALLIFCKALLFVFGPAVLLAAAGAFFHSKRTPSTQTHAAKLLLFFGLPPIFALLAILLGFVQIDQWRWNWRYVLTASLFLTVAGGIGLSALWHRVRSGGARGLVVVALLAMPLVQLSIPTVGVATFDDARRSISDDTRFAMAVGEQIHGIYTEGSIALVTGYSDGQRIMISSGVPLKHFHIIYGPEENDILGSPLHSERYLIIEKKPTSETQRLAEHWLSRMDELLRSYAICSENEYFILLERKPAPLPANQRRDTSPPRPVDHRSRSDETAPCI
jgi:hypothetical protein